MRGMMTGRQMKDPCVDLEWIQPIDGKDNILDCQSTLPHRGTLPRATLESYVLGILRTVRSLSLEERSNLKPALLDRGVFIFPRLFCNLIRISVFLEGVINPRAVCFRMGTTRSLFALIESRKDYFHELLGFRDKSRWILHWFREIWYFPETGLFFASFPIFFAKNGGQWLQHLLQRTNPIPQDCSSHEKHQFREISNS